MASGRIRLAAVDLLPPPETPLIGQHDPNWDSLIKHIPMELRGVPPVPPDFVSVLVDPEHAAHMMPMVEVSQGPPPGMLPEHDTSVPPPPLAVPMQVAPAEGPVVILNTSQPPPFAQPNGVVFDKPPPQLPNVHEPPPNMLEGPTSLPAASISNTAVSMPWLRELCGLRCCPRPWTCPCPRPTCRSPLPKREPTRPPRTAPCLPSPLSDSL